MSESSVRIFHNSRCSKSRATLAILEETGADADVINYLDTPPTPDELKHILALLDMTPRALMRTGESVYRELALDSTDLSDEELIAAMVANPILIERPIVVANGKAVIGRPPENVREIL